MPQFTAISAALQAIGPAAGSENGESDSETYCSEPKKLRSLIRVSNRSALAG
jgi:hypothetical protein